MVALEDLSTELSGSQWESQHEGTRTAGRWLGQGWQGFECAQSQPEPCRPFPRSTHQLWAASSESPGASPAFLPPRSSSSCSSRCGAPGPAFGTEAATGALWCPRRRTAAPPSHAEVRDGGEPRQRRTRCRRAPQGEAASAPTELSAPCVPSPDRSRCSQDWRCEPAELLEHCEERSDARTPTKRGLARAQPTGIKCDPQAPSREMHQALEKTLQGAASKDSPVPRSLALRLWVQHLTPHPAQL